MTDMLRVKLRDFNENPVPLCKNCEYFTTTGYSAAGNLFTNECAHPDHCTVSLEDGRTHPTPIELARRRPSCGVEGKLFEPKEDK